MYRLCKRAFDIAFSLSAVAVLLPLIVIIAVIIKLDSPGPVLYRGVRAAQYAKTFKIMKFRTMVVNAESLGGFSTAIDDGRFTKSGRFLRRYKLDELPQFFNVLFGDMSVVGPRPQVTYYTDKYEGDLRQILDVKPGITDFASVYFSDMDATLGTGDVDKLYEEQVEPLKNKLRLKYAIEQCFWIDLKIIVMTIGKLLGFRSVSKEAQKWITPN